MEALQYNVRLMIFSIVEYTNLFSELIAKLELNIAVGSFKHYITQEGEAGWGSQKSEVWGSY